MHGLKVAFDPSLAYNSSPMLTRGASGTSVLTLRWVSPAQSDASHPPTEPVH